jgi:hypothetical protein
VDTRERGQDYLGRRQWERLRVLRPGADSVSVNDPVGSAVCYPEIITIAGVLASPHYWQAVAADYATDRAAFREIVRRLRCSGSGSGSDFEDYSHVWPTRRHPLSDWADSIRYEQRRREHAGSGPNSWSGTTNRANGG